MRGDWGQNSKLLCGIQLAKRPYGAIAILQCVFVVSGHGSTTRSFHFALRLWLSAAIAISSCGCHSTAWRGFP